MFTCWPVLHVPCYVACRRLTGQARCSKKKFVEQLQNNRATFERTSHKSWTYSFVTYPLYMILEAFGVL